MPKIKEDRVGRLTSGRKSETPSPVNTLEKVLSPSFSIREFVSGYLLRSQNKSSGFDAPRTKHASCRAAPAPGPFCKFTHPYPNLPIRGRRGPPRIPPVGRKCTASDQPKPAMLDDDGSSKRVISDHVLIPAASAGRCIRGIRVARRCGKRPPNQPEGLLLTERRCIVSASPARLRA